MGVAAVCVCLLGDHEIAEIGNRIYQTILGDSDVDKGCAHVVSCGFSCYHLPVARNSAARLGQSNYGKPKRVY